MVAFEIARLKEGFLAEAVDVHMHAFRGYMNVRLGRHYIRAFLRSYTTRDFTIALAALDDTGRLLGYVVGVPVDKAHRLNLDLLWVAAFAVLARPQLLLSSDVWRTILFRLRSLLHGGNRGRPQPAAVPRPEMSLVAIGVAPWATRQGVGRALLEKFEEECAARAVAAMRLSVYPDNAPARTLYEQAGWEPVADTSPGETISYVRVLRPE